MRDDWEEDKYGLWDLFGARSYVNEKVLLKTMWVVVIMEVCVMDVDSRYRADSLQRSGARLYRSPGEVIAARISKAKNVTQNSVMVRDNVITRSIFNPQ